MLGSSALLLTVLVYLCLWPSSSVLLAQDAIPSAKELTQQLSSQYNEDWQEEVKRNLLDNTPTKHQTSVVAENDIINNFIRQSNKSYNLYEIADNRMLDGDLIKRSNVSSTNHTIFKKNKVNRAYKSYNNKHLKLQKLQMQRQTIDTPLDSVNTNIGKAYGDPDMYQSIGDGVYLMNNSPDNNDVSTKAKIKTINRNLPDTTKTLSTIIGNLDKEDKDILDATKRHHDNPIPPLTLDTEISASSTDASAAHSMQTNNFITSNGDIEGVEPTELNMITDIEKNIKADDRKADQTMRKEAEAVHRTSRIEEENSRTGIDGIARAVQDDDKNFIRNNPLAIDPEQSNSGIVYKKDLNDIQKSTETERFLANIENEDDKIKNFARTNYDVDPSNLDAQREKDILNFAAQEDAEILVGGSRSHKTNRNRKRHGSSRHRANSPFRNALKQTNDINDIEDQEQSKSSKRIKTKHGTHYEEESSPDTGFFMADEGNMADLNKKTEAFVENTVNASLVDIIEPAKLSDSVDRRKNSTNSNVDLGKALNSLKPVSSPALSHKHHHRKDASKRHKYHKSKSVEPGLNKEDMGLYKALNKSGVTKQKSKHHSGSVWKVSNKFTPTKIINVSGKPGVQIDLYITGNKGKHFKKKPNFRKANTPKANIQITGKKKLLDETDLTSLDNGVEDVSLNEVVSNQEKQMFGDSNNGNEFGSDKTSVEDIQTDHVEGNEGKQTNDVNLLNAINSDEIKDAMQESDLKGLSQIKNELDVQDAKNTVDFFNQPNSAKPLSQHMESTSIGDISEQIKDTEAGIESEEAKIKDDEDPQKVKIILHIPESISKEKATDADTQEAIDSLTEQAKAFLLTDQAKDLLKHHKTKHQREKTDEATLEAAKKIEEFIKQETKKQKKAESKPKEKEDYFITEPTSKLHETKDDKDAVADSLLNALLQSDSLHDLSPRPTTIVENDKNLSELTKIKEDNDRDNELLNIPSQKEKETAKELDNVNGLKENESKTDPVLLFSNSHNIQIENPHPTIQMLEKFIKTTHEQALSKEPVKSSGAVYNRFASSVPGEGSPLRINGGKVIGGNVRGGNILGGIISGGDISGGEIQGGEISGGTFKNGLFIDGYMSNGVVEGGKIKGGQILGGDIKSGVIEGGTVKGGIIEGGHLINGSVEGGDFKGGEITGGHLLAGEMDGGYLKNGTINGGVLKGGTIESGSLDGGVMLAGTLRGGVVKSGVIKGGIIDAGVIVQDAEIGPGVEIHDGIVKGGKITVNSIPQVTGSQDATLIHSSVPESFHSDENRSNIMYSIEVLPKPTEGYKASVIRDLATPESLIQNKNSNPVGDNEEKKSEAKKEKDKAFLEKSLKTMNDGENKNTLQKQTPKLKPVENVKSQAKQPSRFNEDHVVKNKSPPAMTSQREKSPGKSPLIPQRVDMSDVNRIQKLLNQLENSAKRAQSSPPAQTQQATDKLYAALQKRRNDQSAVSEETPVERWELSRAKGSYISGSPGAKLRISGGVRIHNGHAILDGTNGYMDAGDYQGECFSDPEVCVNGFTIQMTLKIYRDSVFNTSRLFIVDSGAWSSDTRGISVYVSDGRIGAIVATRERVWCLHKILEPYIEKWMSLTITWRKDKGLSLYINCELFDDSLPHSTLECDQCTSNCHKTDVATRLMFGRPNKGPHFKVIHMAVGEISLYEKYSDKDDVKKICGSHDEPSTASSVASIIKPTLPSAPVAPTTVFKELHQELHHSDEEDGPYLWPTPPGLKSRKKIEEPKKHDAEDIGPWPTPARLHPVVHVQPTQGQKAIIDYSNDRRSSLYKKVFHPDVDGAYSSWAKWSPCSQTCGKGVKVAVRYCNNPAPKIGGKECAYFGAPRKFKPCSNQPCNENRRGTIPVMQLDYGTKKSSVPKSVEEPMIIINGQQKSLQELESAFQQLKHKR